MPAAKCGGCAKFISPLEAARCCACNALFHRSCALLPLAGPIQPTWVCPSCRNVTAKDSAEAAFAEALGGEDTMDTSCLSCSTLGETLNTAPGLTEILRSFKEELQAELRQMFKEELRAELQVMQDKFQSEFQAIRQDMTQLQVDRDKMKDSMDGMQRKIETLEQSITAIKGSGAAEEIAQLKRELNDRDQQLLSNDLEITNLPETKSENLTHTVKLIASKLGVKLEDCDLASVDRIGGRQINAESATGPVETRPRIVVVRLVRRDLRDELLRAARVRPGTNTADLAMSGPPSRYYLNERLTKTNRQLFRQARETGQRLGWQFVWSKHGRILARRKAGDKYLYHELSSKTYSLASKSLAC